jgi:hypothetical protein
MDMDLINELEVSRTISVKYLDRTFEKPCEHSTKLNEPIKLLYQEPMHVRQVLQGEGMGGMTHHLIR